MTADQSAWRRAALATRAGVRMMRVMRSRCAAVPRLCTRLKRRIPSAITSNIGLSSGADANQALHVPQERVEVPPGDVGLRGEVPEEGAPGDAGGGRDLLDGRVLEATFGEELERGLLDLLDRRQGVRRVPHGSRARRAMACTPPLETSTRFPVRPRTIARGRRRQPSLRHGCLTCHARPRASRSRRRILAGESGRRVRATPNGESASFTALTTAGGAPMAPPSPTPL